MLRFIYADLVFVVDRDRLFHNCSNRLTIFIQKIEMKPDDIPLQLPSQSLNVRYVFHDMENLVGQGELSAVRHSYEVLLVKTDRSLFQMGDHISLRIHNIGLSGNGNDAGFGIVLNIILIVRDIDPPVKLSQLKRCVQAINRFTIVFHCFPADVFRHFVDAFDCLAKL